LVGHLFLREGGAGDILGQTLPSIVVLTFDLDLIVDIKPGLSLGEELFDQFSVYLFLLDQHLKDLMAEEGFQL
jgi:hypothetical protein